MFQGYAAKPQKDLGQWIDRFPDPTAAPLSAGTCHFKIIIGSWMPKEQYKMIESKRSVWRQCLADDCVPVSSPGTVHPGVFTDVPSASSTAQHWTQEFRVEWMDRTVRILKETKIIQRGLGNKNNQRNTSANEKSVQDQRGRCLHFFCFLVCLFSNFLKFSRSYFVLQGYLSLF